MIILLDTSTLLWQLGLEKSKLGSEAMRAMEQAQIIYVSSISIVEMQIKTMIGKLNAPANCEQVVYDANNEVLAFSAKAADGLRNFPSLIRHDPFDRMLVAQAEAERITLLTSDKVLLGLGLDYIVDATF